MRRLPHGQCHRQQNVPDHSFNPNLSACKQCHATATTFNVNGFQSQIQSAMTEIETWLNGQGFLTRATAAPYVPLTAAQLGDGNWDQDLPTPGATFDGGLLTQDQAGALYDYILVARGAASGVHNPKYVGQLLYDSYNAIPGFPWRRFRSAPSEVRREMHAAALRSRVRGSACGLLGGACRRTGLAGLRRRRRADTSASVRRLSRRHESRSRMERDVVSARSHALHP